MPRLTTRAVRDAQDVRAFFDAIAGDYREAHGDAPRLIRHRLALVRRLLAGVRRSCLVEIGCGNGMHLLALAAEFDWLVGTDLSPNMIAAAETARAGHPQAGRIRFAVDPAERLASVQDAAADAVLCIGAFEHMQDRAAVLAQVRRVLRPGGAFVCLSNNGDYLWYTQLAPRLGLDTRHLSTDRYLKGTEWRELLAAVGLRPCTSGYWRFVPAGDMPRAAAVLMGALDRIGAAFGLHALRGGLYVKALRP